ncbi:MAG: pyrroline-5-carboxylate reductase [Abditibacteriales bacterium]|nr:pyrroline-5-carboxylate reductase [Abditibacteriales bacterium]MDW8364844.1 pyrroline-5-carboxylate reductase [Abditibacteriales bacterium]
MLTQKIAFIGAGAMGEALMGGWIRAGVVARENIVAADVVADRLRYIAEQLQVRTTMDNVEAVSGVDVVLLAVKPHVVAPVMAQIAPTLTPQHTLLSIAAGITTQAIEKHLTAPVPVVRIMPNTPALVGAAASAICLGRHAREEHRYLAHALFGAVGVAVDVEEKLLDAVTGLSGSGPAYVYLFIEALSDAGVQQGLSRDVATKLAAQTVLGAAQMVLTTGKHPGELKDMVTSPGGTTIAGIAALERGALRGTVMSAVAAATQRAKELG